MTTKLAEEAKRIWRTDSLQRQFALADSGNGSSMPARIVTSSSLGHQTPSEGTTGQGSLTPSKQKRARREVDSDHDDGNGTNSLQSISFSSKRSKTMSGELGAGVVVFKRFTETEHHGSGSQ